MGSRARLLISALAVAHLTVAAWHGSAHESLGVTLPLPKMAFVYLVIIFAPTAAAFMIWTRHVRTAVPVFFVSMLASFLFGVYHHYVAVSVDHIHYLPEGSSFARAAFIQSAGILAVLELASSLYAATLLRTARHARRSAS
jgi:hypothetical protein